MSQVVDSIEAAQVTNITQNNCILLKKKKKSFDLRKIHFQNEGYFKNNPYFNPNTTNVKCEVSDQLGAYNISNDDIISGILLICFLAGVISISLSHNFIIRQLRSIFNKFERSFNLNETAYEVKFQFYLVIQTSLLLGILYFLFTNNENRSILDVYSRFILIGTYWGIFFSYFIIRHLLYDVVNWVFFPRHDNEKWRQLLLFLASFEGLLLFPIILLFIYFDLDIQVAFISVIIVVCLVKLIILYEAYVIFFKGISVKMQIILYFCTLEIMPLIALLNILHYIHNYLAINI